MRFLSDDGIVFNTEEECKEHEKRVKLLEEVRVETLEDLRKEYVRLINDVNEWLDVYHGYLEDYPEAVKKMTKKSKDYFDLKDLLDFLEKDFSEVLRDDED